MTIPVAAPPLPQDLDDLLHRLRLPHLRRLAPEVLATARSQRWEPAEVLRVLLTEEANGRERSATATRRGAAGFPTGKTFSGWDESACSIPGPTQAALRTLEWIERRENLVVCVPSGTGKSYFLDALGQAAVEAGRRVAWFSIESLGAMVHRSRADDSAVRAVQRMLAITNSAMTWSWLMTLGCSRSALRLPMASSAWSTPPTSAAVWPLAPTSTLPASTN